MAYSITPQEQQREMQDRQIRAQQESQAAAQEVNAFNALANLDLVDEAKPTPLPMNWQHSADTAARRAAQLEQMNLQHQQRLAELAERDRIEREQEKYKLEMRAKYAPPKARGGGGGTGYLSKLQKEYMDTFTSVPSDPEQKDRIERKLAALRASISRSGKAGQQFLQDFEQGETSPAYKVTERGTKYGQASETKEADREARTQAAAQAIASRNAATDEASRQRAIMALAKLGDEPGGAQLITDPAVKQAVIDAQRERSRMAAGRPAAAPAAPTRAPAAPAAAKPAAPAATEERKTLVRVGGKWYPESAAPAAAEERKTLVRRGGTWYEE